MVQIWKIYRDNDKPAVILYNGNQEWYKDGVLHRDKGPAVICGHAGYHRDPNNLDITWPLGTNFWYKHGVLHRDGGPAVVYKNGNVEWWMYGIKIEIILYLWINENG